MGISRSTYYEPPNAAPDDTAIVEAIAAICDEFEFYGWRRVRAETRIFLLTGFAGVGLFSLGAELQIAQNGSIFEGYGPTYRSHQNPRMGRAGAFATCLMDGCAARRLPD